MCLLGIEIDSIPSKDYQFVTCFVTTHKAECRVAAFSKDGKWAATGSQDASVKLLEIGKMNMKTESLEDRPIIRTLYDHTDVRFKMIFSYQFHMNLNFSLPSP
jgi:cleavage stimulation factor subunit 1